MEHRKIADAVIEQIMKPITYLGGNRLISCKSFPNETVFEYEVIFQHAPTDSYANFNVFISLDGEKLISYTITDRIYNSFPSLSDEVVLNQFSLRDDRQLYYRNLFHVAIRP